MAARSQKENTHAHHPQGRARLPPSRRRSRASDGRRRRARGPADQSRGSSDDRGQGAAGPLGPRAPGGRRGLPQPWLHDRRPTTSRSSTRCVSRAVSRGAFRSRCRPPTKRSERSRSGEPAAIVHEGRPVAIIDVEDIYEYDVEARGREDLRTTDDAAPRRRVPLLAGARTTSVARSPCSRTCSRTSSREYRMTPLQLREKIARARLEDRRCVPDPQPDPPGARVPHEVSRSRSSTDS